MTTLSELNESRAIARIPKVTKDDYRLLWHCDYWDGAKSGVLIYQNKKCWFQVFAEYGGAGYFRRFAILELTEAQFNEELHWHELFKEKVGPHTDYDKNGKVVVGALQPKEMWQDFYDAYKNRKPQDFSNNLVIAWFEI